MIPTLLGPSILFPVPVDGKLAGFPHASAKCHLKHAEPLGLMYTYLLQKRLSEPLHQMQMQFNFHDHPDQGWPVQLPKAASVCE